MTKELFDALMKKNADSAARLAVFAEDADKAARVAKAKAAEAKAKAKVAKAKASAAKAKAKVKAARKGSKEDADLRAYFYEKLGITKDGDVEYSTNPKAKIIR